MQKFSFLFSCHFGKRLLLQTDNLRMTLQSPELCVAEAHHIAQVVVARLRRNSAMKTLFWKEVENKKADLDMDKVTFQDGRRDRNYETDPSTKVTLKSSSA